MAYDAIDQEVVLVGGDAPGSVAPTWTYANGSWSNITADLSVAPAARFAAGIAYDSTDGYVVLFGGYSNRCASGPCLDDTWTFRHGSWTNITSTVGTAPSPRYLEAMSDDPENGSVVLFGGASTTSAFNDTWSFSGGRWHDLSRGLSVAPSPRVYPSMTYDAADGYLLLFGGSGNGYTELGDTWTFTTSGHWSQLHVTGSPPSIRAGAAMAFDSRNRSVVLFGGFFLDYVTRQFASFSDTWRFSGGAWSRATAPTSFGPAGRSNAGLVDDVRAGELVLFGGYDPILYSVFGDTWGFSSGNWTRLVAPVAPPSRAGATLAYDASTRSVILFGGSNLNETWSFGGGSWTQLFPADSPPGRVAGSMAYDVNDSEIVLFGGERIAGGTTPELLNDTWAYVGGDWTNLTATAGGPPARAAAAMAYDPPRGSLVLFGGGNSTRFLADTWTFGGDRWTNATGAVGSGPAARDYAQLAFDPADGYLLLFGGLDTLLAPGNVCAFGCNDTWQLGDSAWGKVASSTVPPGRYAGAMAYDPTLGKVVLFGGIGRHYQGSGSTIAYLNDSWTYVGGTWVNATTAFGRAPPPGTNTGSDGGVALDFDAADGFLFFYSGAFPISSWWELSGKAVIPLQVGIPTASPNPLSAGANLTINVTASGGSPPYSYTWSGLPSGCTSRDAPSVTCAPTGVASYLVRVTVSDGAGAVQPSPSLTLVIDPAFASLGITPASSSTTPSGAVVLTAQPLLANGSAPSGPVAYAWSVAPAALGSLSAAAGSSVSFNAASSAGQVTVFLNASFEGATRSAKASITIAPAVAPLRIAGFSSSILGYPQTDQVNVSVHVTGGVPPYSFFYSGLPSGCSPGSNASTFTCGFSPGTWPLSVEVADSARHSANASTTVVIPGSGASPQTTTVGKAEWALVGAGILIAAVAGAIVIWQRRRGPPPPGPSS